MTWCRTMYWAGRACAIRRCTTSQRSSDPSGSYTTGSSTPLCVILPHSCLGSDAGSFLALPPAVPMLTGPRRICPGRYFAQAGLFITVASVLHVFDITSPLDDHGCPVQITHGMEDGLSSCVGVSRGILVLVVVLNSLHT